MMRLSFAPRAAGLGASVLLLLAGCVHTPPPLYAWGTFPRLQYETLLRGGEVSPEQLPVVEAQAAKARAQGQALPPGFRAHWGLLKFSAGDTGGARELWLAEKQAFPESAPFMDRLLRRLDPAAKSNDKGSTP